MQTLNSKSIPTNKLLLIIKSTVFLFTKYNYQPCTQHEKLLPNNEVLK